VLRGIAANGDPSTPLLVVTHETVVADGMSATRYRVTVAEARRASDGWRISRWEPQP
jgi:hypothetical protein